MPLDYKLLLTYCIKNCRDSRLFKGCCSLQLLYKLTGNRPQSATFHTAKHLRSCHEETEKHQNYSIWQTF